LEEEFERDISKSLDPEWPQFGVEVVYVETYESGVGHSFAKCAHQK
jgi:hypothetical protein